MLPSKNEIKTWACPKGLALSGVKKRNNGQGPVAQLVERCIRIAEVRSSTLLRSKISRELLPPGYFFDWGRVEGSPALKYDEGHVLRAGGRPVMSEANGGRRLSSGPVIIKKALRVIPKGFFYWKLGQHLSPF